MPCSVMLVEDNSSDVDLIRRVLEKNQPGIRLTIARDGEEALSVVEQWTKSTPLPEFILLDLKLPKINGLEVLKTIKNNHLLKSLPVVMLTSSNELKDIDEAYRIGVNSYILKAIDYDEFSRSIALIQRYWCGLNIHPE